MHARSGELEQLPMLERPWSEDQFANSCTDLRALGSGKPCSASLRVAWGSSIWPDRIALTSSKDGPSPSEAMKLLADQGAASFDKVAECYSGPEQRLGDISSCFDKVFFA